MQAHERPNHKPSNSHDPSVKSQYADATTRSNVLPCPVANRKVNYKYTDHNGRRMATGLEHLNSKQWNALPFLMARLNPESRHADEAITDGLRR